MIRYSRVPQTEDRFRRGAAAAGRRPVFLASLAALGACLLAAQGAENLHLTVGKSVVIDYPSDIRQVATTNPDVIDANPVTTREILLNAKGTGATSLIVWSKTGQRTFYNVNVDLNLDPLRTLLKSSFPGEAIDVHSSRDSITLTGSVSSKDVSDRATALAAGFGKAVVNNLKLPDPPVDKQILLRVRFAQLDRSKEQQYGVNLLAAPGNNPIGANTNQFSPPSVNGIFSAPQGAQGAVQSTVTYSISQVLNIFALDPHLNLGALIQALQSESILQVLAEPNLVTSNGKEANFVVGGEFPVPVLQGGANSGAVTVQFREFGIRLTFTPVITNNNTIKLTLRQEVSTLDRANGVTLNGFNIPALSTRRAETNVELAPGQSFVVAGLMNDQEQEIFSKLPVISDLPILGALFKSKDEQKQHTELIMMVTPEITEPLSASDPKPEIYFPKNFLVRLDPKDLQKTGGSSKAPKKR